MDQKPKVANRVHPEYAKYRIHWQWLMDSYEGGVTYRDATYGTDSLNLPIRNLVRHKHEYPQNLEPRGPGSVGAETYLAVAASTASKLAALDESVRPNPDQVTSAYEMRRARTPVPEFVKEALEDHRDEIYAREITRKGPKELKSFWADVDGQGTTIDDFMRDTAAPLLMVHGQIDLLFDRPPAEDPDEVVTDADVERLGLKKCRVSVILPENLRWWRLTADKCSYAEVIVREWQEDEDGNPVPVFRWWTAAGWTLYNKDDEEIDRGSHPYGMCPVRRFFDSKRRRSRHVGQSRYEGLAQIQMEFYNKDSELVLSDAQLAHPMIQGPSDIANANGEVQIGPNWMLLKKKNEGASGPSYEGYSYLDPPKGSAESIRANKDDLRSEADRMGKTLRPAGAEGVAKGTVEQSGISKSIDRKAANNMLAKVASGLRRCEEGIARYALVVLGRNPTQPVTPRVQVAYPSSFDLYTASDVAITVSDTQNLLDRCGLLPEVEVPMLQRYVRLAMPDRTDEFYDATDAAIQKFVESGGGVAKKEAAAEKQARMKLGGQLDPAGNVRPDVNDPSERLQPPGQGGKTRTKGQSADK